MKNGMMKSLPALVLAAGLALTSVARADEHSIVWSGIDFAPDTTYGYVGGFTTLQGQSVSQEGFLLGANAGYGRVHYDTPAVITGHVTNHIENGDIMLGYQALSGPASAKVFIGPDYEHQHDSPVDPTAYLGTRVGAKVQMEVYTPFTENTQMDVMGSYSTAFETYWSRVDATYNVRHWFSVGPEVELLGSEDFNEIRAGAAIGDVKLGPVSFRADAGGSWTNHDGQDGAYGGLSVGTGF